MDRKKGYLLPSATVEWETPQDFFDKLDAEYHFTVDVAATPENAKCAKYYTMTDNGLSKSWGGETVWCNPPYGRVIKDWVRKAYDESQTPGTVVVMLLPARTDTAWFHDYCKQGAVEFIRGRLRFGGSKENAPFPSMVVVFGTGGQMMYKEEK